MSKFENAFDSFGGTSGEVDPNLPKIDWKVVNKGQVDLFGTQEKARSRVGVVSGIIDLGLQELDDAKVVWAGTAEQEAAEIEKNPNTYFEDGVNDKTGTKERYKRWKQKAQRAIAITVDFPQFEYDWGGEIGKKPLRFLLNGEFIPKGKKIQDVVVGRTYDLKETTKDFAPRWSLATNSLPYKLAIATEVIKVGEPFTKKQLGQLIGKHALFEARLWLDDNGYMQDKISFKGEVPEGMEKPAVDESTLYFVNLDTNNDESAVKQLRRSVKNTIKRSVSYIGSKLQAQYESILFPVFNKGDEEVPTPLAEKKEQEAKPKKEKTVLAPKETTEKDDEPF